MSLFLKFLEEIGLYCSLMYRTFSKPKKSHIFFKQIFKEIDAIGINSIGIVVIISLFIGAVITIQTALNLENPLIPKHYIGLGTRESMLLEFSSTVVALILSGKVGSSIASELGTMRITEQIDVLEIMGLNSANYLILPKIIAACIFNPILTVISMFVGIAGGYLAAIFTNIVSPSDYVHGLHYAFNAYYVFYSLVKTLFFAFIITSVASYHGYNVRGGALAVGQASTKAVVHSSITILLFNLILTQLLLT
jgi:phospholipid/cholesterol/gamma-HCH transport system permease protein